MIDEERSVHDKIGPWSEIKLEIIRKYAKVYSTILSTRKNPSFYHIYIDAFAGSGVNISRDTGELLPGSPLNALYIEPRFREYHYIDLDTVKVKSLDEIAGARSDVYLYEGDCNIILPRKVFPKVDWRNYRRALCLLDPYGLHLSWETIQAAARTRTIDLFLNFPISDMNRNVLLRDPSKARPSQVDRMNFYWGDDSWHEVAYEERLTLFGEIHVKSTNYRIAEGFRSRLHKVAGFSYVPQPIPMRNTIGTTVYYLFFASHQPLAQRIIEDIFRTYR